MRFSVSKSPLGFILLALNSNTFKNTSSNLICNISFADCENDLLNDFRASYPDAHHEKHDPLIGSYISQVNDYIKSPFLPLSLPLALEGTPFQIKVWNLLQQIPLGTTMSYSELASKTGMPNASRAVAGACAANKIAVLIPCHRVISKDGSLSGYRWGKDRKEKLILAEKDVI